MAVTDQSSAAARDGEAQTTDQRLRAQAAVAARAELRGDRTGILARSGPP